MAFIELRVAAQQALEALEGGADSWQRVGPAIDALKAALVEPQKPDIAQQVVSEQTEDEGLWFVAVTASEAYLQQALRRLHAAVEGEDDQDAD